MSKKRKMRAPAWKPRPTAQGAAAAQKPAGPDMATHVLRLALMRSCADFLKEAVPILRQMGALGESLDAYVRRVPNMPEAEVRAGIQHLAKGRLSLLALSRLVAEIGVEGDAAGPATPAPGTERKQ